MKVNTFLLLLNLIVVIGLSIYVFYQPTGKKAFIMNQRVFGEFKGTQQLEAKLNHLKNEHKQKLDSIASLIRIDNSASSVRAYEEESRKYALAEQELSGKYTADLWKQINQYVSAFGKEQGYDFIFGATGDGNLMFAHEAYDMTNDVIEYINRKYEDR